ncbi:hypothetical protein Q9Q95_12945 [Sphingomonas sp. DG1-23]|uniref:hypothetical protein n=1 Tax=Sphingomonas sp. DG1-23 TaxID=3068316 RepID=UPI00273EA448|nr:hypothetical protein [Sphingomonas sp. DG1-23]MDP5279834.1 hypothetical protein [Sphingomonas sp. DG1-23]
MTGLTSSPRLIKGALIGVDLFNPLASIVVFQYNPDTMTRRLEPRGGGGTGGGDKGEAFRLAGPPKETITVSVEIDASDQLEQNNPLAIATGITPTLAALEMLVYPKTALVIANSVLGAAGIIEILPTDAPMTLFVWGPTRVLPVKVGGITITEEAYDTLLNPIRAKVELTLNVLSYNDLSLGTAGNALFMVHQVTKEVLAMTNIFASIQNVGAGLKL